MDQKSDQQGNCFTCQKKCEKRYLSTVASKRYIYKKKQLFTNVIEHICDHNTELAKITMITYQNTAKKRCTTSFSNKKVTKNRNQNALKI
jgi:hypothetical protein